MNKSIEKQVECLHPEVQDGRATFFVHMSNALDYDLDDHLLEWLESEDDVSIEWKFTLPFIVEDAISMRRSCLLPEGTLSADSRPLFDAMRRDLVAMIARIDALRFE